MDNKNLSINNLSDTLNDVTTVLKEVRNKLADLQKELAVARADGVGRLAQVKAMEAQHPSSPHLAHTGQVFQSEGHSGLPKTELRLLYEAKFDEYLLSENIENPASFRLD
jgi:hypothetical protein